MTIPSQTLDAAIQSAQAYLMARQYPEGYWWAELESNVTMTAEVVLLHRILGTDAERPLDKARHYIQSQQRGHGGWELFYGDGGELSTSIEAYMGLRLLGVPATDPDLVRAKAFILERGGISKARIFTKFHLALIGCYSWKGVPSIPPWVMLLNGLSPFTIYDMSSWARGSTVPLLIVFDQKPVFQMDPVVELDELYAEGVENVSYELPSSQDWTDAFTWLDSLFKVGEDLNLVPFREEGLQAAEQWILERQEATGDWGGIIPAMLNSMLALHCLKYDLADPVMVRGLQAIDNFAIETDEDYRVQSCISPVWDTAWCLRALVASGMDPAHEVLVKGGEWLLSKQILDYGDWAVKNPEGLPGGWAFEFENRFYPDIDDTATIVMALQGIRLPNERLKKAAMTRAVAWIESMQCQAGGWAAFDKDNDQEWLNWLPYGDLKAMIDPNTADLTARVLEMAGRLLKDPSHSSVRTPQIEAGLDYLSQEQDQDGSWFGRWGVNYIYGTSSVLSALAQVAPDLHREALQQGIDWLLQCQNTDGGWGETCRSYDNPALRGQGASTASQTAWALIGLLDAGEGIGLPTEAIEQGIEYLLSRQKDGSWEEPEFTGTGFPCHFYLRYHFYRHYFPLFALGRYRQLKGS